MRSCVDSSFRRRSDETYLSGSAAIIHRGSGSRWTRCEDKQRLEELWASGKATMESVNRANRWDLHTVPDQGARSDAV